MINGFLALIEENERKKTVVITMQQYLIFKQKIGLFFQEIDLKII